MGSTRGDWTRARDYVFGRLASELSPKLVYHGIGHTRDDVLPAAERLATLAELGDEDLLLLRTAAVYHDVGFVERHWVNEPVSVRIAEESLPRFGYSDDQIRVIGAIIMATRLPQSPKTFLSALLCDADLDCLGREDFVVTSHNLNLENANFGISSTIITWYEEQIAFLSAHSYWTRVAEALRGEQKRRNLAELKRSLAAITDKPTIRPLPKVQVVSEVLLSPSFPRQGWSRPVTEPVLRPGAGSSDPSSS